jgi:hypothetical protein
MDMPTRARRGVEFARPFRGVIRQDFVRESGFGAMQEKDGSSFLDWQTA